MKYFKIIALTIAISLLLTFFGTAKIKAEPVTATLAAATAVVVGGVIISTLVNELGQQLSRIDMEAQQQGAYDQTVFNASVANAQKIQEAYFNEIASELPESSLDKYQIAQSIFDPKKYLSYAGVSYPSELSPDDRLVYYALSNAYSKVNSFYVDEANQGLKLSSDDYIDMLHASVSEAYEAFSGIPLDFSLGNGLGMALLKIHAPSSSVSAFYPALASRFNANVYRYYPDVTNVDDFMSQSYIDSDSGIFVVPNSVHGKSLFYVFVSQNSYSVPVSVNFSFDLKKSSEYYIIRGNFGLDSNSSSLGQFNVGKYDRDMDACTYFQNLSWRNFRLYPCSAGFPYSAAFEFSSEDNATAFVEYLSTFVPDSGYDPSTDVPVEGEAEEVVLSPGLSDVEKSIAAKQSELGVTDVDVGFTADGVTVDDTNVADIDISQSLDISDTIEKFETPNSITTKFPFSLPFDIYHVFNILSAEPKIPHFNIPLDFSSIGGQVYNIGIDLSDYDFIANIVRWLLYGAFLVGLIILTNKLIGRG